jgi:hypothetical protein
VHGEIHQQLLRGARPAAEHELDGHSPADGDAARRDAHGLDRDRRFLAVTQEMKRGWHSALHCASQGVLDNGAALGGRTLEPGLARLNEQVRVNLAQVVEVVRDAPPHHRCGIVFQHFEEGNDAFWMLVEP